jgi:hypothetical protein
MVTAYFSSLIGKTTDKILPNCKSVFLNICERNNIKHFLKIVGYDFGPTIFGPV